METFNSLIQTSYTAYHAVKHAAAFLEAHGFVRLEEGASWDLHEGGRYYTVRNGSSLIAFRHARGPFKIAACHTDSPCLKLKEHAEMRDGGFTRLNCEVYGGALHYSFFDRPLKIAGRIVRACEGGVRAELYESDFRVVLPSLAIHMNRAANENFAPNMQTELPLLALGEASLPLGEAAAYDLFAVPDEAPAVCGLNGEFICSPRLDNLTGVYACIHAVADENCRGACIAACLDSEEIGSHTRQGAAADFLKATLTRIFAARQEGEVERLNMLSSSLLLSVDNAHSVHPNHPELCDPSNRAVMGGGVTVKFHAGGAYTTNAVTAAAVRKLFASAGVKHQTFFNRTDMRSGSTLGALSLLQVSVPSVDLGIAQLAMHAAVETAAISDVEELKKGISAVFRGEVRMSETGAEVSI